MEVFRLDKAIDNEKLDLELAIAQLKKEKEKLSQSLKRRKELANQMNDHQYVEENIEDLFPSSSSDEANNAIKELLEKNGSLQEEVRKLKREQEIQSTRLCEVLEQRNKVKEDLNERINQHENLIDQISNASEEIMTLRSKNEIIRNELRSKKKISERLANDLNTKRQINERMMKSQEDMNQLHEQNLHKKKGKEGLGYKEEGESSKQGTQRNQKPTCNHCGKLGHTSNKCWSNGKA